LIMLCISDVLVYIALSSDGEVIAYNKKIQLQLGVFEKHPDYKDSARIIVRGEV